MTKSEILSDDDKLFILSHLDSLRLRAINTTMGEDEFYDHKAQFRNKIISELNLDDDDDTLGVVEDCIDSLLVKLPLTKEDIGPRLLQMVTGDEAYRIVSIDDSVHYSVKGENAPASITLSQLQSIVKEREISPIFSFEHEGMGICDPFLNSNGTESVDPVGYYGFVAKNGLLIKEIDNNEKVIISTINDSDPESTTISLVTPAGLYSINLLEDIRNCTQEGEFDYIVGKANTQGSPTEVMSFEKIMKAIGGDWGTFAFLDEASQKYIKISVTYDADFVYEIFDKNSVAFDPEFNEITKINKAEPLAGGHYGAFEETEDVEHEFDIWNENLAQILAVAKSLNVEYHTDYGLTVLDYNREKGYKAGDSIDGLIIEHIIPAGNDVSLFMKMDPDSSAYQFVISSLDYLTYSEAPFTSLEDAISGYYSLCQSENPLFFSDGEIEGDTPMPKG